MDIKEPLNDYGKVDIGALEAGIIKQDTSFWEIDNETRTMLAGDRPGGAVYYWNDSPNWAKRIILREAATGYVNVLRSPKKTLFYEISEIIEDYIMPHFPHCGIMRVQLAELPSRRTIAPHHDRGILSLIHRMHVPIMTNEDVVFTIANQPFFLRPSQLYELNNVVRHSVCNNSHTNRIHLLVDLLPENVAKVRYHETRESMQVAMGQVNR